MAGFYIVWPPGVSAAGGGVGVSSIGSMDSQAQSVNGASVGGSSLFMQSASSSSGGAGVGLVNTVAQPFLGTKTFVSSPIVVPLAGAAPVQTDATGKLVSASVSLTTQVSGVLPLANTSTIPIQSIGGQTSGSISLTAQVSGVLPLANTSTIPIQGGGQTSGSISLVNQVVGNLPLSQTSGSITFTQTNFVNVGINNTSGSSSLFAISSGLTTPSVIIQALPSQTGDLLRIQDSTQTPKFIFDSSINFKLNHNQATEAQFDIRPSSQTTAISSGSAARFSSFIGDSNALAAGRGGGIGLGAIYSTSSASTELGYIWVTKDNATAGDNSGSLHLATRNNATGNAQRAVDIDAGGNSTIYGTLALTGSVSGKVTIGVPSIAGSASFILPAAQGAAGSFIQNDGSGNLSWGTSVSTLTTGSVTQTSSTGGQSYTVAWPGVKGSSKQVLTIDQSSSTAELSWSNPATNNYACGYFSGSSSTWRVTSTTFADTTASGTASAMTYTSKTANNFGSLAICSNTNIPGIVLTPHSPNAVYFVKANFNISHATGGTTGSVALTDGLGTTIIDTASQVMTTAGAYYGVTLSGIYAVPNSASNQVFKIQGAAGSGAIIIGNAGATPANPIDWTIYQIY